jgi:hypothetical protein
VIGNSYNKLVYYVPYYCTTVLPGLPTFIARLISLGALGYMDPTILALAAAAIFIDRSDALFKVRSTTHTVRMIVSRNCQGQYLYASSSLIFGLNGWSNDRVSFFHCKLLNLCY